MQFKNTQIKNRFPLKQKEDRIGDNFIAWRVEWLIPVQRTDNEDRRGFRDTGLELPIIRF